MRVFTARATRRLRGPELPRGGELTLIVERGQHATDQILRHHRGVHSLADVLCEIRRGATPVVRARSDVDSHAPTARRASPELRHASVREPRGPDDDDVHVNMPAPRRARRHLVHARVWEGAEPARERLVKLAPGRAELAPVARDVTRRRKREREHARAHAAPAPLRALDVGGDGVGQALAQRREPASSTRGADPPLATAPGHEPTPGTSARDVEA